MNQMDRRFATALLRRIRAPVTAQNLRFLYAWGQAEGTAARYNPLATVRDMPGASNFNSVGVKNFRSLGSGVEATAQALENGLYPHILSLMRSGRASARSMAAAVAASPWGTHEGVLRVLGARGGQPPAPATYGSGAGAGGLPGPPPQAAQARGPSAAQIAKMRSQAVMSLLPGVESGNYAGILGGLRQIKNLQLLPLPGSPGVVPQTGTGPVAPRQAGPGVQLLTRYKATHDTDGIAGYQPSIDIMSRPGRPVYAPEDGQIFRYGHAQGGHALYFRGRSGRVYWIGHIENAGPKRTYRRGAKLATVSAHHPRPHVHEALLSGYR